MPDTEAQSRAKKKYREKNKEILRLKQNEYYEKNKVDIIERRKEYILSVSHKKSKNISQWKSRGVISDNYDELHKYYVDCNICENCNVSLVMGNFGANKKCLDHDHKTGLFRKVLCNTCNNERWKF